MGDHGAATGIGALAVVKRLKRLQVVNNLINEYRNAA
jgi:hypothetical protein